MLLLPVDLKFKPLVGNYVSLKTERVITQCCSAFNSTGYDVDVFAVAVAYTEFLILQ